MDILKPRLRRLNIRLSQQEWDKVHLLSSKTTCRSVSEYTRKVLLGKPVNVYYRNKSFDNFEEQMTRLLSQLEDFGDNFDQLIKKLSSLENVAEVIKALPLLHAYIQDFVITANIIKMHIVKLADQCDPK